MIKIGLAAVLLTVFSLAFLLPTPAVAEYGDIVLDSKMDSMEKAGVPAVVFPHWFHRIRFKCKVCHENIFIMKKGANDINMGLIMDGEFCGTCHDGLVAWEALYCDRCHSHQGN
ncbi:MAG: hypothetical protein KAT46_01770 [Deltaproteobacteria bacterium]|nr:hypothetical protein [Deltaproteobacteria bacterium]